MALLAGLVAGVWSPMFEVIKLSHVRIQAPPLTAAVSAK
jgi:hypothetical protein